MDQATSLSGSTILLIEDDFYLAEDTREALEGAGGKVLGPCATASGALGLLGEATPDCAVVDVNLGAGPSFDLASAIRARGIPMLFVTGYDPSTIPSEFADVPHLGKPVIPQRLVAAVAQLCRFGKH